MNQRLGFQCFTETLFEDAGNRLYEGELDPRVLVSYYPELRGNLFSEDDTVDVMAGVAEHMPQEDSVDDISELSIVPHLVTVAFVPYSSPFALRTPSLLLARALRTAEGADVSLLCGALIHSPPIDFDLYPTPVPPLAISRRD